MSHDYKAQQAETFETFDEIGKIDDLPQRAVVNFLFLAEEVDAPFAAAEKALKAAGFATHQDEDGETLEARIGPMEISAAAIWAEEKRATEVALKFGFDPDGWELVE
ncbi:ribonuclease E inhibitor RraB [Pseudorhodobacter sp.]|uniref:ribonuclease E inhibitor RraB n=1 Tax=Pseudorhodobacter sp. TaxID=1934400 RepID=UPI0026481F7F|nr:ribonuclease E inhibitor RraB [Pseudorhodobacter sp.]MDN5787903.1 ribonuclease E inhibitor RraB [Pseudorhodobacter sp.]